MKVNGKFPVHEDYRRRVAGIVILGLPSDCVAIIVLTRGLAQATALVLLVLVAIVALRSFATGKGD